MKYQVSIGLDIYIPVRAMFPVYGSQKSNQSSTYQDNYVQSAPISKDPTSDQHIQPGISTIVTFYFLWLIMRSNVHCFMLVSV